jgi:hypothetical protein
MESSPAKPHDRPVQALARDELHDFNLVVSNARSMGWLAPHHQLSAVRCDSSVVVRTLAADAAHERSYEDGQRWLYQFLHELSQGLWKPR